MSTRRLKLVVAYRGTAYYGWQRQARPSAERDESAGTGESAGDPRPADLRGPDVKGGDALPTVQQALRRALVGVVRHPVTVTGSSRTDSGVHAKGQVAHFDTTATQIPLEGLRRAVNSRLPSDVVVRAVEPVGDGFHAIRSTLAKRYQYRIHAGPDRAVFAADLAWHRWQPLDVPAMAEAASHLVGTHDFTSFARPGHGRASAVRTVDALTVHRRGDSLVIGVTGGGFLWNMVRIIVGTLVDVAEGRRSPDGIPDILAARDRKSAGGTAPAHGLYLQWVRTAEGVVPPSPEAGGGGVGEVGVAAAGGSGPEDE